MEEGVEEESMFTLTVTSFKESGKMIKSSMECIDLRRETVLRVNLNKTK